MEDTSEFLSSQTIQITRDDGTQIQIESEKIIIATGSKPSSIPGVEIDKQRIITSTEVLKLKEVPKRLLVIGGGIIGLELGSVFSRLGSAVQVVEYLDYLIPSMDGSLRKEMLRTLKKQGLKFFLSHVVQDVKSIQEKVLISAMNKKEEKVEFEADYCLVAVGRDPYTEGLKLEAAGLEVDERGRIPVDENLQTKSQGIYAIGDVV